MRVFRQERVSGPSSCVFSGLDETLVYLGDGDRLISALRKPAKRAFRIHPGRGNPSPSWGELMGTDWSPSGRFHDETLDPGCFLDYHSGCIYPQDAASQIPVLLLNPQPGELIMDACAAPGSKTTQIAQAMDNRGLLIACDASPSRRRPLIENLARQGVYNTIVSKLLPSVLSKQHPELVDALLLDLPCSGHLPGKHKNVLRLARKQHELLDVCSRLVRPGGRMVYSTCSPCIEENEWVVSDFLKANTEWVIEKTVLPGTDGDLMGLGGVRTWPHRQGTEPFYACLLIKGGKGGDRPPDGKLPNRLSLSCLGPDFRAGLWATGENLWMASPEAAACPLSADMRGLYIGKVASGRRLGSETALHELKLHPWGAQALIENGATSLTIPHEQACLLWSGASMPFVEEGAFLVRTEGGAPLGLLHASGGQARLKMPSRHYRRGVR
ncbi:MAG: RsmB/NOP family class I SAM-dependent RNA methyltransferase [Planctomycetes bacterium]|nr:RsmB/NOP family class I SAM-dependent RNA methyltransferase [Planctomycetota bacterium]